jgi:hypothetical protein
MSLSYLSRTVIGVELAPFNVFWEHILGCQGVIGPFPSAFLDKSITKNWRKVEMRKLIYQIFFG